MREPELKRAIVLSDSDPMGNAVPGTAKLAIPTLDQNEIWVTREGRVLTLDEMAPGHRVNLICWLENNALGLFLNYQTELATGPLAPMGDMATLAFEREQNEAFDKWMDNPIGWLEQTPFYQRLQWLIEQDRANGQGITA